MKPHDARSKRAARSAVRTHLRNAVGWLRGFPADVSADGSVAWVTLPDPRWREPCRHLVVDRRQISRTIHRLHALERRFPRALPELVGDAAAWRDAVNRRLDLLKAQVHEGRALPDLAGLLTAVAIPRSPAGRVRAMARPAPTLVPLLACVAWSEWANDGPLAARLAEVERRATTYQGVLAHAAADHPGGSVALAHQLLDLRLRGEVSVELLELFGDRRLWELPPIARDAASRLAREFKEYVPHVATALDLQRPAAGGFARKLASEVMAPSRSRGDRRRRLEVMGLLAGPELLDERQAFWERLEILRRDLSRRLGIHHQRGPEDRLAEKALLDEVGSLAETRVHSRNLSHLLAVVDAVEGEGYDLLVGVLGDLPRVHEGDRLREAVVHDLHWYRHRLAQPTMLDVLRCVRAVQREVGRDPASGRSHAWVGLVSTMPRDLTWEAFEERRTRRVLGLLEEAAPRVIRRVEARETEEERRIGSDWMEHLLALLETGTDAERAAQIVSDLPFERTEHALPRTHLEGVARLAQGDARAYADLCALFEREAWEGTFLDMLTEVLRVPGFDEVLRGLLLGPSNEEVLALLRTCAGLEAMGTGLLKGALDALPTEPEGGRPTRGTYRLDAYPPQLANELRALARHDPDAPRTAASVLGRRFPTPEDRETEMAHLRALLSGEDVAERPRLEARLHHLRTWRSDDVSPQQLERHAHRLRRRVHLARLRRLHAAVQRRLEQELLERIGSPRLRETLAHRGQERLVAAIAAQEPAYRELGFRLLRRRSEKPRAWDLRDVGANRAFCERARARGLDLDPWLDPAPPVVADAPGGTRLHVAIEADPLEVMRMGQPFDTCLSPGAFNFFAAIVNAADVNKQVLYARDPSGAIRGRCLLTLTTEWTLLTYQPYTSKRELRFDEIARDFAVDLARRMGTSIALQGDVETLLAPDWYCDLPRDLVGHRQRLETLRTELDRIEAGDLPRRLREVLGVDRLPPWVVSAVVEWGELTERPERFLELRDLCEPAHLPAMSAVRAARLLRLAGDPGRARRLLQPLLDRAAASRDVVPGEHLPELEGELAQELVLLGDPMHALRLLRLTREAGCRRWEDECAAQRLEAAGMACEALYRRRQARDLYTLAIREDCHGPKDGARRRLKELEV